jgi:hypothetical protein
VYLGGAVALLHRESNGGEVMREHIEVLLNAFQEALHIGAAYRMRPRAARSTFVPVHLESRAARLAH